MTTTHEGGSQPGAAFVADFDTFFREEVNSIVRDCWFILGDREAAKECAQEAFTRLYVKWNRVSRYDKPGAWVRRVAIRIAIKSRNRDVAGLEKAIKVVERQHEEAPTHVILDVRQAVLALPRAQRAAVTLYYFHDLPIPEVAAALKCREGTAKAHLFKARTRLAELLSDYAPSA